MILKRLVARGFLRPSHHYLPCRKEEVLIPAPWGKVQAWREHGVVDRTLTSAVIFLRFLGSRGRAELATLDPADRLPHLPSEVWTINPPGFGATTGPPDLERYADAAVIAMRRVLQEAAGRPVWICGKSIGTTAALLAAREGAAGLILRNVAPLGPLLAGHYASRTAGLTRLLVEPAIPPSLDSVANSAALRCPALFIVSQADRVSPPEYQALVIDRYAGPKRILKVSGGHDDRALAPNDDVAYREALADLINSVGSDPN